MPSFVAVGNIEKQLQRCWQHRRQTLAYSAEKNVGLVELTEGIQNTQDEIRRIKRAMDRSRKASNPGMFYSDGRVIPKKPAAS